MVTYKSEKGYSDVWSKKEFESQKEARKMREDELTGAISNSRAERLKFRIQEENNLLQLLKDKATKRKNLLKEE
jgi:hypothetical protein